MIHIDLEFMVAFVPEENCENYVCDKCGKDLQPNDWFIEDCWYDCEPAGYVMCVECGLESMAQILRSQTYKERIETKKERRREMKESGDTMIQNMINSVKEQLGDKYKEIEKFGTCGETGLLLLLGALSQNQGQNIDDFGEKFSSMLKSIQTVQNLLKECDLKDIPDMFK